MRRSFKNDFGKIRKVCSGWGIFTTRPAGARTLVKIWRRGLDLEPANATLLNSLAYAYAEAGVKLAESGGDDKKSVVG